MDWIWALYGAAFLLWCVHGYLLYGAWGRFRPHIALLHGLLMGALGLGLAWLGLPLWALSVSGLLVGAVGALGHRLVPGLWIGAMLAPLHFTLGAQVGATLAGLLKPDRA